MNVLVVKTSSLGDVIHALPALTDAARAIPNIRFDWVVEEDLACSQDHAVPFFSVGLEIPVRASAHTTKAGDYVKKRDTSNKGDLEAMTRFVAFFYFLSGNVLA